MALTMLRSWLLATAFFMAPAYRRFAGLADGEHHAVLIHDGSL